LIICSLGEQKKLLSKPFKKPFEQYSVYNTFKINIYIYIYIHCKKLFVSFKKVSYLVDLKFIEFIETKIVSFSTSDFVVSNTILLFESIFF